MKGLVAACLVVGFGYVMLVPIYEGPNEPFHVQYAHHLATEYRLPPVRSIDSHSWWDHRPTPPLYHALGALCLRLSGLTKVEPPELTRAQLSKPNRFEHDRDEVMVLSRKVLVVRLLRLLALLGALCTGLVIYRVVLMACDREAALLAVWLLGCLPAFAWTGGVALNDSWAAAMGAVVWWLLMQMDRQGVTVWRAFGAGVVTGLALLTKLTAWYLVPAGILLIGLVEGRTLATVGRIIVFVSGTVIAVGPWMVEQAQQTGGWTGITGQPEGMWQHPGALCAELFDGSFWIGWFGHLRLSLVGLLGWDELLLPHLVYWMWWCVILVALVGWIWGGVRRQICLSRTVGILVWFSVLISMVGLVAHGLEGSSIRPEGRLLWPALPPIMLMLVAGLRTWSIGIPRWAPQIFVAIHVWCWVAVIWPLYD